MTERSYYRLWPDDENPEQLLDPSNQLSTPWGEPNHGPCDKCGGSGQTDHRCRSCVERGAEQDCPACQGRVEFRAVCPACEGDGVIDRTVRDGVSVFPTVEGLCAYVAERGRDPDECAIIELVGELSPDTDLDADAGALLIRPTRVVGAVRS
jgi:hypothetical protein